ncbi:hypothetical protein [Variovorax sp. E3]|uniref:hypothetical protein n=1 Tax=Variovorax sp. E3 TaxID=1914993 RepID=UPI0018DE291E|nr:hypothetical protein [Variovorax sp. E3]
MKHQVALKDIVWLEPADAEAVVYLLRAPHDKSEIVPVVDDAPAPKLPVETYIALRLSPGVHRLAGIKADSSDSRFVMLPVELKAGERRFFYSSTSLPNPDRMSGPVGNAVGASLGLVGAVAATAFAAALHKESDGYGIHRWVECTDLDARGLASFSKEILTTSAGQKKASEETARK